MNGLLKWSLMGLFVVALLVVVLLGPGRLYGLLKSRQLDGQVVEIQPTEPDDEGNVETYLIKLHGNGGVVHVFASSDDQWMMVKRNDWVRVRLYPAPPWSGRHGQWQNAGLAAKLIPPKPEMVITPKPAPAKPAPAKPAPAKPAPDKSAPAKPKPVAPKQKTQAEATQTNKDAKKAAPKQPDTQMVREYRRKRPRGIWRRR